MTARSYLFVPGNRPERFDKAHRSGADRVILDLEDAVAEDHKDAARAHVAAYLRDGGTGIVRINATPARWRDDVEACVAPGLQGVMLPKAEHADDIARVVARVVAQSPAGTPVYPLIETALGMTRLAEIAAAPGVERLVFGTVDFRTEMGIEGDDEELLLYRSMIVLASKVAGIGSPIDGVTVEIGDTDALHRAALRGRRLGFGAKLCIHPSQVAGVNTAFRPTAAQVQWAQRVLAAAASSPGAFQIDGAMVDAPVMARAREVLQQAEHPLS